MKIPIVVASWLDTALHPDWLSSHDDANLTPIKTVGYLLYEDENVIKIAQSNCANIRFSAIQSIPKTNILELTKLFKK